MNTVKLIRRDVPLEQGRVLMFKFTTTYEVPLDENVLDWVNADTVDGSDPPLEPATLAEIEQRLGDEYSERILKELQARYIPELVEHDVTIDMAGHPDEVRFETSWEKDEREADRADQWRSREWLDEVPAPPSTTQFREALAGWGATPVEIMRLAETDLADMADPDEFARERLARLRGVEVDAVSRPGASDGEVD